MNNFNAFTKRLREQKVLTPLFLLAILVMVILPLPPGLLDFLFTFNIVLSVLVILVSVSVKRPLDFSVFPTVILTTTLMRLTLNVASTRIVLLHGHEGTHAAGQVIESFGSVVIGGNFVVGLVVFIILMIINFIVVTKGAERVSEVSARFTLDALPGKQMAIDADLNSGLINQEKAQARRREVGAEADFYGAMDGASKFVRGDAIAGILILLINIIGGITIGSLMHDLSFSDAFRQYALLTIGDGLVAQIPALLLSAAAAIIVTRVSDSGDFEQQITTQMLASPKVFFSAAAVMFILAVIPGMPRVPFLAFSVLLTFIAWRLNTRSPEVADETLDRLVEHTPELTWNDLPHTEILTIAVGYKLIHLIDPAQGSPLLKMVKGLRKSLSETMGILLPPILLRDDLSLKPAQYAILLNNCRVTEAEILPDRLMAIPSAQIYGEIEGIPGTDPAYAMPVIWIATTDKAHALGLGYQVIDCLGVIVTHLNKIMRHYLPEFLSHDDVSALITRLAQIAPKLAASLEKALSSTLLLKVFRGLLAEGISLQDIEPIANSLLEASESTKDPILLTAEARCTIRRQIIQSLVGYTTEIKGFSLTGELENMLLDSLTQSQQTGKVVLDNYPVDPNILRQLQVNMPTAWDQMKQQGIVSPLLLVTPQIRPLLARYARLFAPGLSVLSYNEVPEHKEVIIVGTLG